MDHYRGHDARPMTLPMEPALGHHFRQKYERNVSPSFDEGCLLIASLARYVDEATHLPKCNF